MATRTVATIFLALLVALGLAGTAAAATPNAALALTSDGSAGDPFAAYSSSSFILNTDTGSIAQADNSGSYLGIGLLPSVVVTQPDGSQVRVFEMTSFTVPFGDTVNLSGSLAAAIVASGDITISGTLNAGAFKLGNSIGVGAGAFAGGQGVAYSNGLQGAGPVGSGGGGGGGVGTTAHVDPPCCGYDEASGGGGGGSANGGQAGNAGSLFPSGVNGYGGAGGNPSYNPSILQGGSGGGAGAGGSDYSGNPYTGNNGAPGGGALLLETPGTITIGTGGAVVSNGQNGIQACSGGSGAGGGGGGGALWFAAGTFVNNGQIDAIGGAGADGRCENTPARFIGASGAGSGGVVVIDPVSIVNNGIINVSDGNGLSAYGGLIETFGVPVTGTGSLQGEGVVPEPGTWALVLSSLAALCMVRRRRI